MWKIKCDINQQYLKTVDPHLVKSEVVDRVSKTQLQMGENSDLIIWLKGLNVIQNEHIIVIGAQWVKVPTTSVAFSLLLFDVQTRKIQGRVYQIW